MKKLLQKILPSASVTTHRQYEKMNIQFDELNRRYDELNRKIDNLRNNKYNEYDLLYLMCVSNEIANLHKDTFSEYKDIYRDREVVVLGAGPTLNEYVPIKDAVHIGVNGTYKAINLDYLFIQDFEGSNVTFNLDEIKELRCKKFVGHYLKNGVNDNKHFPKYVGKYIGAKDYYVCDYFRNWIKYNIPLNMVYYPVVDNASSIFAAMQFALYTHPKRIYIVGCDCSCLKGQHFDGSEYKHMDFQRVNENWDRMKHYIDVYYPDISVVSINPIGLSGMFEDVYT